MTTKTVAALQIGSSPAGRARTLENILAYESEMPVNWCPELGTVLANEEVIDGKSERGGYPVVRKPMRQWVLKITEYAERLLADLDTLDALRAGNPQLPGALLTADGSDTLKQAARARVAVLQAGDARVRGAQRRGEQRVHHQQVSQRGHHQQQRKRQPAIAVSAFHPPPPSPPRHAASPPA